jgi:hypothetical protein
MLDEEMWRRVRRREGDRVLQAPDLSQSQNHRRHGPESLVGDIGATETFCIERNGNGGLEAESAVCGGRAHTIMARCWIVCIQIGSAITVRTRL